MSEGKYFVGDSSGHSSVISAQLRELEEEEEEKAEEALEPSVDYGKCCVFHCAHSHCNLVLGDSLGVCGEVKSLKAIICLSKHIFKDEFIINSS